MRVGLRIDVDTFRGTRIGVPNLCALLARHGISATFFFSVGPDNMGRHILRLRHPRFLWKMLRTRARSLYGPGILLKGTLGPGPLIGEKLGDVIRAAADAGHETGLHEWDHYSWQAHIDKMGRDAVRATLQRGHDALAGIIGRPPECSAVPGWQCTDEALLAKERFPFKYNSDCRGDKVFRPLVNGTALGQPQIPVTLPTYDELIGRNGISDRNYNQFLMSHLRPAGLNVLAVHAEVEGIARLALFEEFLTSCRSQGWSFSPLGVLLDVASSIGPGAIARERVPGRLGWISVQAAAA